MRVISGTWRGRILKSPKGQAVRPTTDRVKEALFSMLGADLPGALFLDLCCGAGGLGIEALSRGARKAVFVDVAGGSLKLVQENLALCGAAPGSFEVIQSDALHWVRKWAPDDRPWVAVADPPYRSGLPWSMLQELERMRTAPGFRRAVIEHGSGFDPTWDPEKSWASLAEARERKYGRSVLAILGPLSRLEEP
jgi:16S rRNA (guanine966-N2)-methyltransferase